MSQEVTSEEFVYDDNLMVEYWPIEKFIPSPRNTRTHSPAQIAEIAGSIRTFGFTNPILVGGDADVVAGHRRLAAARQVDLTQVPVIPLRGLSEIERRALMLADNRMALNTAWDAEMLKLELTDLAKLGAYLKILGINEQELAEIWGKGLWTISSGGQDAETKHATQKPVERMRRPMLNNSSPVQAIYEPFLGERHNTDRGAIVVERVCLALEIEPLFVDVAIRRWQVFTGEKAIRECDRVSFEELEEQF